MTSKTCKKINEIGIRCGYDAKDGRTLCYIHYRERVRELNATNSLKRKDEPLNPTMHCVPFIPNKKYTDFVNGLFA